VFSPNERKIAGMTNFLNDILKQPEELSRSLRVLLGSERDQLEKAISILSQSQHIYLTGIGASLNAAMAGASFFHAAGYPIVLLEASELLHFGNLAPGSAMIIVSRSGRSIEIVNLIGKAKSNGVKIIAITNSPESPLALECDAAICVDLAFDHAVSVTMYSALAMASGLVAGATVGKIDSSIGRSLNETLLAVERDIAVWREKIEDSDWAAADYPVYFLARGSSLASCHEARLLWEEAGKSPASAMSTGGFRHGPQEIVTPDLRFCLWLDQQALRSEDLEVADDLRKLGARVMLIGERLSYQAGDLVFSLPSSPSGWQFLIDIIPAQLAAERFARLRGVDCDSLRYCSYIVENEGGILQGTKNYGSEIGKRR
jgi:glutamine---fructose-6-phosphate transaminase (isomerizing)